MFDWEGSVTRFDRKGESMKLQGQNSKGLETHKEQDSGVAAMSILQPKQIVKRGGNKVTISWEPEAQLEDQFVHASHEDKAVTKEGGNDRTP